MYVNCDKDDWRIKVLKLPLLTSICTVLCVVSSAATDMKQPDLNSLLKEGLTLKLGGEGMGYVGELVLSPDGNGRGFAQPDGGAKIQISGKWQVKDNKFCREWSNIDSGAEVCEEWRMVGPNKVEVYKGDTMIGLNSW